VKQAKLYLVDMRHKRYAARMRARFRPAGPPPYASIRLSFKSIDRSIRILGFETGLLVIKTLVFRQVS
jgi:hypothetical protein